MSFAQTHKKHNNEYIAKLPKQKHTHQMSEIESILRIKISPYCPLCDSFGCMQTHKQNTFFCIHKKQIRR